MAIDGFDGGSGDDQIIPIRGKRFNISSLEESIALILRPYGSLYDCRELTPSEIIRADLRAENLICVRQFKKGKWGLDRYPISLIGLRVFKVSRSSGSGGTDTPQASVMLGGVSKPYLNIDPTVFISSPTSGTEIELTDKTYVNKNLVGHTVQEGETAESIVKNITGKSDLAAITEMKPKAYNKGDKVLSGYYLKVENGLALKVSGTLTNSEFVKVSISGAVNGTKTLELEKAGKNVIVGWVTEFPIDGGHGLIKIEADSGGSPALSEPEILKPNWVEILYTEDGKPIGVELDYIIKFDDGTRIRAKLKNGSDFISMVPFSPFTIEFLPTKEKQKELDELYKKLDQELKDKINEVEKNSAQLKKEWEAHPWYMKKIVGNLYALKGAAYWVYETIESMWTLAKGTVVSAAKTSTWIAEYQLHKEKLLVYIVTSNKDGITEETAQLERMAKEASDDVTELVETAKTLYYLAHDDRIGTRLKEFIENYFTALSPQEQHEFVTRYGIDIVLIFVGGSGAAILGVKNAAKISQYLNKMAEILKVFKYKFKPKVKGKVNEKNTYEKIIKPKKMKQATLPCFKKGGNLKKNFKGSNKQLDKGFKKQLKNQEAGLNNMTVGEYRKGRELYSKKGRSGTGAAQDMARKDYAAKINKRIEKSLRKKNKNLTRLEAKKIANEKTNIIMDELAALHDPDMIAGGKDKVTKLGNKRINSSLGSQWSSQLKGDNKGSSRVKELDKQVEKAYKKQGDNAKMNVKLDVCGK